MPNEENVPATYLHTAMPFIVGPMTGAFASHIPRVLVNRAVLNVSLTETWKDSKAFLFKGLGWNVLRCYSSVLMQYSTVEMLRKYYGEDYSKHTLLATFAPALSSTLVAVTFETPFIRKTILPDKNQVKAPFLSNFRRPTPHSFAFYLAREMGSARYLFGNKDIVDTLLISAYTSMCLTGIIWTVTEDKRKNQTANTLPNFSQDGTWKTLRGLARGDTYTHPSCQVPFKNAKGILLLLNLVSVTCGHHLFVLRFLQLGILGNSFEYGAQTLAPKIANKLYSIWKGKPVKENKTMVSQQDVTKRNVR